MKKLIILALAVIASGCAHQPPRTAYAVPDDIRIRIRQVMPQVTRCIAATKPVPIHIADAGEPNAWYDYRNDKIVLTSGLFRLDDEALAFVISHEIAHEKLGHVQKAIGVSYATTGVMMVVNAVVPGAGLLNHVINPAVVNNYSKTQESDADREAYLACVCMGISRERVIQSLSDLGKSAAGSGGGFWDRHPSWDDRIANIREAP